MSWNGGVIERTGAWILMRDQDGRRHGWKVHSIQGISDADIDQTSTIISVSGGRHVVVEASLEEVAETIAIP